MSRQLLKSTAVVDSMTTISRILGLRLVLLVGMPATIGLLLLAEPMFSTLFQYNEFGINDVYLAGQSLRGYSDQGVGARLYLTAGYENTGSIWDLLDDSQLSLERSTGFSFGTCRPCSGNVTGRFF